MLVDYCQGMIDIKTVSILSGGIRHMFGGNRYELKHNALTRELPIRGQQAPIRGQ